MGILDLSVSLTKPTAKMALQDNTISSTDFSRKKYFSLVEQIIDESGDGISPEDLLHILDSRYDVVNVEHIDDALYGLQMEQIVNYDPEENLYKYERDEINLLIGPVGGGIIKLINPEQFLN